MAAGIADKLKYDLLFYGYFVNESCSHKNTWWQLVFWGVQGNGLVI